jgi:hypothetical protein
MKVEKGLEELSPPLSRLSKKNFCVFLNLSFAGDEIMARGEANVSSSSLENNRRERFSTKTFDSFHNNDD